MTKYTKEDIIRIVDEENVKFIRLQFADIFGTIKNVTVTKSQLSKALDNQCMFDGSSIEGFVRIEESDMYLRPDLNSFVIFPFGDELGKTARLICDTYTTKGEAFQGDPRNVLQKVLKEAKEMGFSLNVGPELEFFLFNTDEKGNPTTQTNDDAGYFDFGPIDSGEDARRDMCNVLEKMGFEIEASHHEVARGQHEIDFKYDDALTTADNIQTFKLAVKTVAKKHNLHATFMPKPIFGICGNGMHINMSLSKNGKNAFYDKSDKLNLSETAYHFIAGIMDHIKGIAAVTNPLVNSYKRLVPGYEAPVYIAWSASNRSPLIRIPSARGEGTRVELRNPDPSCNPYLAIALLLAAGLEGIKKQLMPTESIDMNIYEMSDLERNKYNVESLPSSLENAIEAMEKDEFIARTLGPHVYSQYVNAKKKEWMMYTTRVSQWEIDQYLINF